MSKGQVANEFEWVSGGNNDLQLLGQSKGASETGHFEFLREGYLYMIEEEKDHLPHGIYSTSLSPSPTATAPAVGGAHTVLVRRTSDPTIKVDNIVIACTIAMNYNKVKTLEYNMKLSIFSWHIGKVYCCMYSLAV